MKVKIITLVIESVIIPSFPQSETDKSLQADLFMCSVSSEFMSESSIRLSWLNCWTSMCSSNTMMTPWASRNWAKLSEKLRLRRGATVSHLENPVPGGTGFTWHCMVTGKSSLTVRSFWFLSVTINLSYETVSVFFILHQFVERKL